MLLALTAAAALAAGPPLTLTAGDAVAGREVTFTVSGLAPGETALVFGAHERGAGPCFPVAGLCSELGAPARWLGSGVADATGMAEVRVLVPPAASVGPLGVAEAWVQRGAASAKSDVLDLRVVLPDDDGDGYRADRDCDDADARARPGQTQLFTTPRASGGWDFDCDGKITTRYPWIGYCGVFASGSDAWGTTLYTCEEERGFTTLVACGEYGDVLSSCTGRGPAPLQCATSTTRQQEACR